ncbi:MAG: hypothetical protein Q8S84_07400 [bacterium]|nr:hypothetical protein [bacterium]MDP3381274.1 hypothetical protein [bacterium]
MYSTFSHFEFINAFLSILSSFNLISVFSLYFFIDFIFSSSCSLFNFSISFLLNFLFNFFHNLGKSSTFTKFIDNHQILICLTSSTTLFASQNR